MGASRLTVHRVDRALDDAERAALVFDGDLVVHTGLGAVRALVEAADRLIRAHFAGAEPSLAQRRLARAPFLAAAAATQSAFGASRAVDAAFADALAAAGVDVAAAAWDRRALRILPSGDDHAGGRHSTTHVHRDTWGSNLYAQVNWWAPVYPLREGRTVAFFPAHWREPVANSSDRWSFEALMAARREGTARDYPTAPEPLRRVDAAGEQRVLLQPGELLCFSGAHLHVGVANRTGRTRFSMETRTLSLHDLRAGRGAPNVDGHGRTPRTRWFRGILDGRPLPQDLVPPVPAPSAP